jgi:hypothetical protein
LVDSVTHNININNNQTILLGGQYYGVQINRISSGSDDVLTTASKNNMLSRIDISTCIKKIRSKFQVSDNFEFYISKVDMDSALSLDNLMYPSSTKIVNVNLYTWDSKEKIDLSTCNGIQNTYNIPITVTNTLSLDKYRYHKNESIDIFDPTSEPFTSRCFSSIDRESGFDSTINLRRTQFYQNISATCNNDCLYNGIDDDNYLTCSCQGIAANTYALFKTEYLQPLPTTNQGVIECIIYAYNVSFKI